ncbi:hypothetical protein KEM60_02189 [Austwickia sp. TVS 96-490-7B]|uniref:CHAP domain-containing protein n=1 Tax=Austwickia sp. TVS 96-490-7B TaxID=2830843 RepID=UPI001C57AEEB|nr:CHAP domain-containing protein [Austwickia sp. TVS 96-490-7B]MBW3085978.1 hypothetical protein [Austwickia sp. TVS 96-490-7B]
MGHQRWAGGRHATVVLVLAALSLSGCAWTGTVPALGSTPERPATTDPRHRPFPPIDEAALSPRQKAFLATAKVEYQAQRPGKHYSEGIEEQWCADFVSWIAKESGRPFANIHTGGWRVPGVYTLTETLQKAGAWRPVGSGYTPKLGDVVIYEPTSPWGHHTNYMLAIDHGKLITIGGNEEGGVSISEREMNAQLKIVGYGAR